MIETRKNSRGWISSRVLCSYLEKQDGQVLYTYDADGRRVSMSDLTGTSQYATNEEGEITGVRQGDGSLIQYEYDAYGNI